MKPLDNSRFAQAASIIARAHEEGAFPAGVIEVGDGNGVMWREAFGRLDYDADALPATEATLFDLASLTKVIGTGTLTMRLVEQEALAVDDPVSRWLPEWRGKDRESVTIKSLLTHSAGLSAWLPFYRDYTGRQEFQHAICSLPLEYPAGTQAVYSDLGFILLGFILEDAGGAPLDDLVRGVLNDATPELLMFRPPAAFRSNAAPTEFDPWRGRRVVGEVHDENAWALGGVAGHSGLFGTVKAVGDFGRVMLRGVTTGGERLARAETMRQFVTRVEEVPGSRALAWDTMLPTSSCGTKMSAASFGHTGFTGTSLWIDPERAVYVVLLTNRVNPTRENNKLQQVRPRIHDAIMDALGHYRPGPGGR